MDYDEQKKFAEGYRHALYDVTAWLSSNMDWDQWTKVYELGLDLSASSNCWYQLLAYFWSRVEFEENND